MRTNIALSAASSLAMGLFISGCSNSPVKPAAATPGAGSETASAEKSATEPAVCAEDEVTGTHIHKLRQVACTSEEEERQNRQALNNNSIHHGQTR